MRVSYIPPSVSQFDVLFHKSDSFARGGSLNEIATYRPVYHYGRGGGFIGTISRIVKNTIPFLRSILVPEIGNFAKNVAQDYGKGNSLKKSLKRHGIDSVKNVGKTVIHKARGGRKRGRKKEKLYKSRRNAKKRKINHCMKGSDDVFSQSKMNL